jgi:hypothetical protein
VQFGLSGSKAGPVLGTHEKTFQAKKELLLWFSAVGLKTMRAERAKIFGFPSPPLG